MRCSKCGTESLLGKRFCVECGSLLPIRCPKCGAETSTNAKFCADCGTALGDVAPAVAAAHIAPVTTFASGERRHLTVLFCDLVGSTEIAAKLDPEEWRETVAAYHRAAAEAITRYGGYVAQYLGDGVMAFFGYPEAHDNDAERAARAGTVYLAQAQALSGAIGDALETIEQVLQPNRPDANLARLEAFRLHGELQTKQGHREPAEADFRKARTLAHSMEAKAYERRAATSLARLLRDSGRHNEARTTLAEIYNWFTEGFDTADLKDAKALLEELAT